MALHEYFGLDTDILWDLVGNEVPDLKRKLWTAVLDGGTISGSAGLRVGTLHI